MATDKDLKRPFPSMSTVARTLDWRCQKPLKGTASSRKKEAATALLPWMPKCATNSTSLQFQVGKGVLQVESAPV
jgi:hypothetical protein